MCVFDTEVIPERSLHLNLAVSDSERIASESKCDNPTMKREALCAFETWKPLTEQHVVKTLKGIL
jgi:hypothetical protein